LREPGEEGADSALEPPRVNVDPGPEYAPETRLWQGIPGIERAENGRLWAVWYSGGKGEGPDNYVTLVTSDDDGATWSMPRLVIDPPGKVRAYDPALWRDPLGRMWLFWAQSREWFDGRCGVWAIRAEDAGAERPAWSATRRLCNGIMMNKPTVLSGGEWLAPAAVWASREPRRPDMEAERRSNVVVSTDAGETWTLRGGADVPERTFDEHMVVERRDGSLWMLVRTRYGVGESFSYDKGFTWTPGRRSGIAGPDSRFHVRRLSSGRLLLVNHFGFQGRSHLTAMLSEDDGATWPLRLLLDERSGVSYPDAVEAEDGRVFVIYDRDRHGAREILMAVCTEEDIMAGRGVSGAFRLRALVNRAGGGGGRTGSCGPGARAADA